MKGKRLDEVSCETCRFYESRDADSGLCRRNPPWPHQEHRDAIWPYTCPAGWCGEYQEVVEAKSIRDHVATLGDGTRICADESSSCVRREAVRFDGSQWCIEALRRMPGVLSVTRGQGQVHVWSGGYRVSVTNRMWVVVSSSGLMSGAKNKDIASLFSLTINVRELVRVTEDEGGVQFFCNWNEE